LALILIKLIGLQYSELVGLFNPQLNYPCPPGESCNFIVF